MERNSLRVIPIMSPVKLVGVSHSHSHRARRQPRATTLDRIDVVTQIGSTRLKQLHAIVERLAARGETPAAFGRRCIPADFVAPPSNIPDIAPHRAQDARWGPRSAVVAPVRRGPHGADCAPWGGSAGRLAALGATLDFHHGLLAAPRRLTSERLPFVHLARAE